MAANVYALMKFQERPPVLLGLNSIDAMGKGKGRVTISAG